MIYPITNWAQTQAFGSDPATYAAFGMLGHNGCDAAVAIGTPVRAPEDAVVIISGNNVQDQYTGNPVDGETVALRGKYEHWLLHNSKRVVSVGQKVKQGDIVAYSGNTGFTTGPHCHWGTRPLNPNLQNGYRGFVDPVNTLKEVNMNERPYNKGDATNLANDTGTPENIMQGKKDWNDAYYSTIAPELRRRAERIALLEATTDPAIIKLAEAIKELK